MTWILYVIAGEAALFGFYAVMERRGRRHEQRAKFTQAQQRAAERDARYQRWQDRHTHGAKRVGPNDGWWLIPGDKAAHR